MSAVGKAPYATPEGIGLAASLVDAGLYVFTTADAERLAPPGLSANRVPYLLKQLVDAGWLVRLRRGLYAGTGRLPGGVDVPAFVIATSLVTPSAISHWSALAYHDLTDQIPLVVTVTTPKKVVTPSMRAGGDRRSHTWTTAGVTCRFTTVRPELYFGAEAVWIEERFRVSMTDRERTVLDLFATPRLFGGVSEGLSVLQRGWQDLDVQKLADYAVRYGAVAVGKRVGWALERVGAPVPTALADWPAKGFTPLDPGMPRRGPRDRRWMIIENLGSAESR